MGKVTAILRWVVVLAVALWTVIGDPDEDPDEKTPFTEDQMHQLHRHMDINGDGELTLQESLAYSASVSHSIAQNYVEVFLEAVDNSKDRKISLGEHIEHFGGDEEENAERAKFVAADENQDEVLEGKELISMYSPGLHDGVLSVSVQETIRQKDSDGDGQLSMHEFWTADEDDETHRQSEDESVIFQGLDADKDGLLSSEEIRMWESGQFQLEDAMTKMFQTADKNNDTILTAKELADAREEISSHDAHHNLLEWAEHHEL
eukprot:TRINITY_DN75422_c0_g1_i1.p1 TRINITY_DN75422_c0_g1~~TRINITY_DN75422_c0_g1_i1.p1  ORF type:complete len:262 (-),score=53.13 TRINITY_DN75422_c0_g1_i1:2-787(-)